MMDTQETNMNSAEMEEKDEKTLKDSEIKNEETAVEETAEPIVEKGDNKSPKEEKQPKEEEKTEEISDAENAPKEHVPSIAQRYKDTDFTTFTQQKLVATLRLLVEEAKLEDIKELIERLQSSFYRQYNQEKQAELEKFTADGGNPDDFAHTNLYEEQFHALLGKYRQKKAELNKELEAEKENNLAKKYEIIERIKSLINKQESLSDTFKEFNELQERWKKIGLVPLSKVNELWRTYHHHVENFYDYIRINKELRDLDFKKNLEIKEKLLANAEELTKEKSVKKAFDALQKLHDKWKETGPVKRELREELWQKFKTASHIIHKRHQEHFVNLKNIQKENLAKKEILCEKVEALIIELPNNPKQWNKVASQIKELQNEWKTVGFAPKKYNQAIYERFRKACDTFFQSKRELHKQQREEFKDNMDKKIQLCEMAEAVMNSDDWKTTTDYLVDLQKQWKSVGPVPHKHSQKLWDRFRLACDYFFDRRSGKIAPLSEEEQAENLTKKQAIIEQIKSVETSEENETALKDLQKLQTKYHATGFVPLEEKDAINKEFSKAISAKFSALDISEEEKELQEFIGKYSAMIQESDGENRVITDRIKLANKVKQLENNIVVWGNNIGFFSNSSNAEKLIAEVEKKIKNGKEELKVQYQKLRFLDKLLQ